MVSSDMELSTLYEMSEVFYSHVHCKELSVEGAVTGL